MKRIVLLILNSLGIGATLDAANFGSKNANTFAYLWEYYAENKNLNESSLPINIPYLLNLGLGHAALASSAKRLLSLDYNFSPQGKYGYCVPMSQVKQEVSGYWEIVGLPLNGDNISSKPKTLLEKHVAAGGTVYATSKIAAIFAHRGISKTITHHSSEDLFDKILAIMQQAEDKNLIFCNFGDCELQCNPRPNNYIKMMEKFDQRLPELQKSLRSGDIVIITGDHGYDPTFTNINQTREHLPLLVFGPDAKPEFLGRRDTLADIGQSIATYFGLEAMDYGNAFL